MMTRKLFYAILLFCATFILKETSAKPSTGASNSRSVLECVNKNDTNANHLLCCNDLSTNQRMCAVFSHNGDEIEALINGVTTTINSTESTCTAGSGNSSEVCLNVKTFDNQQLCFSLSSKNGSQSNTVCASLPALHVNGSSAVNRRDLFSSLSILSALSGYSGGLGPALGVLSNLNSFPYENSYEVTDYFSYTDIRRFTDSYGSISSIYSTLSTLGGWN